MPVRFTNHIPLSDDAKAAFIQTLNAALPTTHDLEAQVRQALWDIPGPEVFARHELIDAMTVRLLDFVDEIAKRATTAGGDGSGATRSSAERHLTV